MLNTEMNSLPLDVPSQPAFGRETFKHEIKVLAENLAYDDIYYLNTQSVWFRRIAIIPLLMFFRAHNGMDSDMYDPSNLYDPATSDRNYSLPTWLLVTSTTVQRGPTS